MAAIMVVDDEAPITRLISHVLANNGHGLACVSDFMNPSVFSQKFAGGSNPQGTARKSNMQGLRLWAS